MTWTNAFDAGECTVKVSGGPTEYYSGVLTKGGTSGPFFGAPEVSLQVNVSADGDVSLEYVSGSGQISGYVLRVIPSYSFGDNGIRASGITINSPGAIPSAFCDFNGVDGVDLTPGDAGSVTPDPAVLSDLLDAHLEISIYQGNPSA